MLKKIFILSIVISLAISSAAKTVKVEHLASQPFGNVTIYKQAGTPNSIAFFIVDGKANHKVSIIMKSVINQGGLVVNINLKQYLSGLKKRIKLKRYYPAGDIEDFSFTIQKKYKFPQYLKPILIGYSAGAPFVYGTLAQAPAGTFKGVIAFNFSPEIDIDKPLNAGSGLKYHAIKENATYYLDPVDKLSSPFFDFHDEKDKVFSYSCADQFFKNIKLAKLIYCPNKVRSKDSLQWVAKFRDVYEAIVYHPSLAEENQQQNKTLQSQHLTPLPGNFPVVLIPSNKKDDSLPMVFLISGDGGWTSFESSFCDALASRGMPVVILDAQKYFWSNKTPEGTSNDIGKAAIHYMEQWHKKNFVLAGYSFGASIIPFISNRFTGNVKQYLRKAFSLSPDVTADFEIHLMDMLGSTKERNYNVVEETRKCSVRPVFIFGQDEDAKIREQFAKTGAKVLTLPGTHHYNNNTSGLAETILKEVTTQK